MAFTYFKYLVTLTFSANDLPDINQDALPVELKWHFSMPACAVSNGGRSNKELPPIIGEAKVREFDNCKNFAPIFFACSQVVVNNSKSDIKKFYK